MSFIGISRRQREFLSWLLSTEEYQSIETLLKAVLERLIYAWPGQAGRLFYISPYGEAVGLTCGEPEAEVGRLTERTYQSFTRHTDQSEPIVSSYALTDSHLLIELPLKSGDQGVGLLHLIVDDPLRQGATMSPLSQDEDLLVLLAQAIGSEADKLAMLSRARRELRELNLLHELSQTLVANLDLPQLLHEMKVRVPQAVGAERCSIFLLDPTSGELVLEIPGDARQFRMPADCGIVGWVVTHGVGQIVNDVVQDSRWYNVIGRDTDFTTRSILCVPMRLKGRIIGAMQLLNTLDGRPFTDQDMQLLTTLAAQAAIAIENTRLYQSLRQEHESLLTKEAEVRRAIARDFHDGPTQSIAAIAMSIEFVKRLFRAMPEQVPAELATMTTLVNKALHEIRTLLFELRPLGLETQGLHVALQRYVERWHDASGRGIQLRLEVTSAIPRLPAEQEAAVFMILQEATSNAHKHAQGTEISIQLRVEHQRLIACVQDDGGGFDLTEVEAHSRAGVAFGLLNMHERAERIGAELRISSVPAHGTSVELSVPLCTTHPTSEQEPKARAVGEA